MQKKCESVAAGDHQGLYRVGWREPRFEAYLKALTPANKCILIAMFSFEKSKERLKSKRSDGSDLEIEVESLVREDGVRLDCLGRGREGQEYFRYADNGVSFDLIATRREAELNPTDTWEVLFGLALKKNSELRGAEIGPGKARTIAQNIREALMAWPRRGAEPAIRHVKFRMTEWPLWSKAWGDWL